MNIDDRFSQYATDAGQTRVPDGEHTVANPNNTLKSLNSGERISAVAEILIKLATTGIAARFPDLDWVEHLEPLSPQSLIRVHGAIYNYKQVLDPKRFIATFLEIIDTD
jgi:hypothetical protein